MTDLVLALAPGGPGRQVRRVAYGAEAVDPSRFVAPSQAAVSQAVDQTLRAAGLKVLPRQVAISVLGPGRVAEVEALGERVVTYVDSARAATEAELAEAKKTLGLYDQILAKVAVLQRAKSQGIRLSPGAESALDMGRRYLNFLAQPMSLVKRSLGSADRIGLAPVVAVAAGWTTAEIVGVVVAVTLVAAIICLAVYYTVSQVVYARTASAVTEVELELAKCANDMSRTPAERADCTRALEESIKHRPKPPPDPADFLGEGVNLLWATVALVGIVVFAYVAAPFLSEAGRTGASELSSLRQGRERSRKESWLETGDQPHLLGR